MIGLTRGARSVRPPRADGDEFERAAEALLTQAGLTVVARNWTCRRGEIDLIMSEGATLVFVEVRKRSGSRFGGAAESIGRQKRERLRAAISLYLSGLTQEPMCRVDAVLFEPGKPTQWLKNIVEAT
ncbi:MAG: YraN family protein [Burkholderiales bacterium]|nr:YraN family protein [Burkholderiales bacterium]